MVYTYKSLNYPGIQMVRETTASSGYRGVYHMPYHYRGGKKTLKKNKRVWLALVIVFNKRYHVGYFETAEEAARAYDAAIDEMGIDYGQKNFYD